MPYERRSYGLQWVKPVPRIPDSVINSVVYLYANKLTAEHGEDSGASGFLFAMKSEVPDLNHAAHVYAVTNKHVLETGSGYPVVRANLRHPSSGFEKIYVFPFSNDDWVIDPSNDLAVCPMPYDFNLDVIKYDSIVNREMALTREQCLAEIPPIGPGDDVVYVGRFMGHAGRYENMPSVRFGNISMNPNDQEPIAWETSDRHYEQVGYLVEARSRSGYSGSPVFTLNQHVINNKRSVIPWMDMKLLGVDWGHLPERIDLTLLGQLNSTKWQAEIHSGMMGVVPSWCLLDFIDNSPSLIEQRQRDDESYKKNRDMFATGVPDVLSGGDEQTPKDR
jgi:hypothetical protein